MTIWKRQNKTKLVSIPFTTTYSYQLSNFLPQMEYVEKWAGFPGLLGSKPVSPLSSVLKAV